MSASSWTRSLRSPFGRFFQVSFGKSDTMSRSSSPSPSTIDLELRARRRWPDAIIVVSYRAHWRR